MLKRLKEADANSLLPYVLTAGPLLMIMAFFVPFIAVMMIQDLLFFSRSHWSFIRPREAYLGFGAGMIWLAVCLFSLFAAKVIFERKKREDWLSGLHIILMLLALPIFVLSIYHYAYLDEHGVQVNSFWSMSEESLAWDNVVYVSRVEREGSREVLSYTFSDGEKSLTIPYTTDDYQTRQAVNEVINVYAWEVETVIEGET
ncbi:hypothetical protein [Alkalicoccus daliensis]|uniref:DUF5673 domain-containing protein n=1 Tax=Alkalicoccus daliensis TaxID=745820 RepID=A0A1H0CKE7_9BACI|nr:hypothetical protein [Alkalicoccus daliensis]SDN58325.1 hypothetical protein SAMN04488053_102135 [Alkalicoccus daliensis]